MNVYADTSFLVSLYGRDPHSPAALSEVKRRRPIFLLTPFGEAEFTNAVQLRIFHKEWTPAEARAVAEEFLEDVRTGILRIEGLPLGVYELAHTLSRRRTPKLGTRTLAQLRQFNAVFGTRVL